jgi:hypothetical protein
MPHVATDAKVNVVIADFRVYDCLDDGVGIEVGANQVADIRLRPRFEIGVWDRAQVDDERREVLSLAKAAIKDRRDLTPVDVPVSGAKRIDARVMHLRPVLADGVAGATGADRRRRRFVRAEQIVGRHAYNIHVPFVARQVCQKDCRVTVFYPRYD